MLLNGCVKAGFRQVNHRNRYAFPNGRRMMLKRSTYFSKGVTGWTTQTAQSEIIRILFWLLRSDMRRNRATSPSVIRPLFFCDFRELNAAFVAFRTKMLLFYILFALHTKKAIQQIQTTIRTRVVCAVWCPGSINSSIWRLEWPLEKKIRINITLQCNRGFPLQPNRKRVSGPSRQPAKPVQPIEKVCDSDRGRGCSKISRQGEVRPAKPFLCPPATMILHQKKQMSIVALERQRRTHNFAEAADSATRRTRQRCAINSTSNWPPKTTRAAASRGHLTPKKTIQSWKEWQWMATPILPKA